MNPCHIDINWTNNQTPAINDTNLGQINTELREIDTRVCSLANDPAGEALVSEGWAEGTQDGVPVTSGSPYYQNNSDYHRLESEGWANGEQDGVPVTSGSPYYENNAKYWKEQAAAIAGQTLGGLTDVSITTPADGQALVYDSNSSEWVNGDVGSQTTNPNLLINGWFTVNQRGFTEKTSASNNDYCYDRWISICSGAGKVQSNSGGVKMLPSSSVLAEYASIAYKMEDDLFNSIKNKTLTASVLLSDGTIISATANTGSISSNVEFKAYSAESPISIQIDTSKRFRIIAYTNTIIIRAVKLEVGSASTLHLDLAPDYTTELLKCRRYYVRLTASDSGAFMGFVTGVNSTAARMIIDIGVPMRTTPTLSSSGSFSIQGANQTAVSSFEMRYAAEGSLGVKVNASSGITAGYTYVLFPGSVGDYIEFSAEL